MILALLMTVFSFGADMALTCDGVGKLSYGSTSVGGRLFIALPEVGGPSLTIHSATGQDICTYDFDENAESVITLLSPNRLQFKCRFNSGRARTVKFEPTIRGLSSLEECIEILVPSEED